MSLSHACCWDTFYIFAVCGLVGQSHLTAKIVFLPRFQRQPSSNILRFQSLETMYVTSTNYACIMYNIYTHIFQVLYEQCVSGMGAQVKSWRVVKGTSNCRRGRIPGFGHGIHLKSSLNMSCSFPVAFWEEAVRESCLVQRCLSSWVTLSQSAPEESCYLLFNVVATIITLIAVIPTMPKVDSVQSVCMLPDVCRKDDIGR